MSCGVHGPDSFLVFAGKLLWHLLAEKRASFAPPSTPVELLDADPSQRLSTASFTHLVLLFISPSLLSSDSFLPRPFGFLKASFPQTWGPTQVTQYTAVHEGRKV